jgi:hypothetical protein
MAPASPDDNKELPVIWLLPPPGLQPSKHSNAKILAIVAAIVTVTTLIILVFLARWFRKCRRRKAAKKKSGNIVALKSTIRVVHPPSTLPVPLRADTSSEMFKALQAEDYHKDSAHKPTQANAAATTSSPPRISYEIPSYYENAGASNDHANGFALRPLSFFPWQTPSSSVYSHSGLYPAPLVISKSRGPDKVSEGGNKQDGNWI